MQRKVFIKYLFNIINSFNISVDDFFKKTKDREIVEARHIFYWLCYNDGKLKISVIVRMMKDYGYNIGHSSVIYGINTIDETEDNYQLTIKESLCLV